MPTFQFSEGLTPPQALLSQRKQLLNHVIDGMAQIRPDSVWAKIPKDLSSYDAGYRKVTYRTLANAINGMAWWIKRELGGSTTFETLAYFGTWDPRYIILLLGAVKAGYKAINIIPELATDSRQYQILEIPDLTSLLDEEYPHYPFSKTFESARSEPLIVVHTSGTTGEPKPLIYSHDWVASWIQQNQLNAPDGYTSLEHVCHGIEVCAVCPANHSSNLLPNLFAAIPNQMVVLFPLPNSPVTFETAMNMIRWNSPDLLLAPAHVLDGVASNMDSLKEVATKVSMISFGGGPLSKPTGDILTQHFRVFGMYGTSELSTVHKVVPRGSWDRRGWNSWKPHPKESLQFRLLEGDNYEAFVIRNNEPEEEQAVFKIFPELQEWSTRDMFNPDPYREGFWSYHGRVDDLIILSNGGSVNPLKYEDTISALPFVKRALMCGTGKPQTSLLVELQADEVPPVVLEDLWAAVDTCNGMSPPQSQVSRSHVITTSSAKPLPRSAKGTVQRALALEMYQVEIDKLYG